MSLFSKNLLKRDSNLKLIVKQLYVAFSNVSVNLKNRWVKMSCGAKLIFTPLKAQNLILNYLKTSRLERNLLPLDRILKLIFKELYVAFSDVSVNFKNHWVKMSCGAQLISASLNGQYLILNLQKISLLSNVRFLKVAFKKLHGVVSDVSVN